MGRSYTYFGVNTLKFLKTDNQIIRKVAIEFSPLLSTWKSIEYDFEAFTLVIERLDIQEKKQIISSLKTGS